MNDIIKTVVVMGTGHLLICSVKKIGKYFIDRHKTIRTLKLSTTTKVEVVTESTKLGVRPENQATADRIMTTPLIELIPTHAKEFILFWETMKQMHFDAAYAYPVLNMEAFANATCQKLKEGIADAANELAMLEKPLAEGLNNINSKVSLITEKFERVHEEILLYKYEGIEQAYDILSFFVSRTSSDKKLEHRLSVFYATDSKGSIFEKFYIELMGATMTRFITFFGEEGWDIGALDDEIKSVIKTFATYEEFFRKQRCATAELSKIQDYLAGQKDIQLLTQQEKDMENNP